MQWIPLVAAAKVVDLKGVDLGGIVLRVRRCVAGPDLVLHAALDLAGMVDDRLAAVDDLHRQRRSARTGGPRVALVKLRDLARGLGGGPAALADQGFQRGTGRYGRPAGRIAGQLGHQSQLVQPGQTLRERLLRQVRSDVVEVRLRHW